MTATQIARKDFEDAVRSKMLWGIIALFVGFMAFILIIAIGTTDAAEGTSSRALGITAQLGQLFVPLIALIAGYMSVVGERRTGSLRVLLAQPHSRRSVVFGKLFGRGAVIAVALTVGSIVSGVLVALLVDTPDIGNLAGLLAAIVLFGVAYAGIAVGISATVGSRGKAMALALASILGFLLVWDGIAAGVYAAVTGSLPGLHPEPWYFLLERLSPVGAFRSLAEGFVGGRVPGIFILGLEEIPANASPEDLRITNRVLGTLPFYLQNWFAALTLALWGLVPTLLGYLRFERTDL